MGSKLEPYRADLEQYLKKLAFMEYFKGLDTADKSKLEEASKSLVAFLEDLDLKDFVVNFNNLMATYKECDFADESKLKKYRDYLVAFLEDFDLNFPLAYFKDGFVAVLEDLDLSYI